MPSFHPTVVPIAGTFNLRDHGGYATPHGRVRARTLMRSDALVHLDAEGQRALADIGLRTAIDLREAAERAPEPASLGSTGARVIEIPVLDGERLSQDEYDLVPFALWLIEQRGATFAQIVELLSEDDALPAVYFCASGKDRTGMLSALVLSAIGVSDRDVAEDYALTEVLTPRERIEEAVRRGREIGVSETRTRENFRSPAFVMEATLAHLREHHGGAREYLLAAGVDAPRLAALEQRLVIDG